MKRAKGRAPGKIILIGEHAVVYGHPAIAIPVKGMAAEVVGELTRNGGISVQVPDLPGDGREPDTGRTVDALSRLVEKLLAVFGEGTQGVRLDVHSDIPIARGMGSSAAVCVAAIRAVCGLLDRRLGDGEVAALAFEAEKTFHDSPSGIDNNVVALEQPVFFVKRKGAQPIEPGRTGFRFLVADTGIASSTAEVVADVRRAREADRARYDSLFWEMGSMASVGREVIRAGSRAELGMCMDRTQELLSAVGVSCEAVDRLIAAAREAGAAGAKLSGAGRGGNVIALLGDETDEAALATALKTSGAQDIIEAELAPAV